MKMAGEDGTLTKENFTKILRSSDMFLKAFDKSIFRSLTINVFNFQGLIPKSVKKWYFVLD